MRTGSGADGKPWRRRYLVCRNEAEAQRDRAEREAILAALDAALRRGDKSLVGNRGYRRFLKLAAGRRFEIDPRRVALDALFDGTYVLCTNIRLTPLQAFGAASEDPRASGQSPRGSSGSKKLP